LVAASAAAVSVGWPGYSWDQVSEVLLYPDSFDRDYKFGVRDYAGQAHPWGIVILSVPALLRSFTIADEPYHVGYHEFAHLLDLANARFDGIPPYLPEDRKSTRLNSSHVAISYAVFCLKKKKQ